MTPAAAVFKPRHYAALLFCYFGALGIFNPYAPLWFSSLGLSTLAIGAFASLQSWTRVLAPYAWGWLADHGHGRVKLLRVGAALSVLGCVALLLLPGYGTVALAVAVAWLFLSNGGISPLGEAVVIKHLHDGDGLNAKAYSRIRVWGSVGFIVSVVGAGNVLQRVEISALPWLTLGAFLSLYLVIGRLPDEPAAPAHQAQRAAVLPVLRRRPVAWFFAGTMLTVLAHTGQYAFFSLFLKDLGYSKGAIGLMWAASVAAEIGFFLLAGRYFARVNDLRWLQFAALAAAARFSLTAAVGSVVWVLVLLQALHALTFSGHHMACTSALGRYFPEALRGRGSALYSTLGYGVPGVVGGLAGGALSQAFGLAAVFWGSGAAALAALACYIKCAAEERREAAAALAAAPASPPTSAPASAPTSPLL